MIINQLSASRIDIAKCMYRYKKRYIDKVLSTENPIKNTPENEFTQNNSIEEYLERLK